MRNNGRTIGCGIRGVNREHPPELGKGLTIALVLILAVPSLASASLYPPVAQDLGDHESVFASMWQSEATELPAEALAYYEAGLDAARRGDKATAEVYLTRAADLDHALPHAHLALARVHFFSSPRKVIRDFFAAARAATASFGAQHHLLVNGVLGTALFLIVSGILFLFLIALETIPRVHHSMMELLKRRLPGFLAGLGALVGLVTPVLWQIGLLPLVAFFAGLMWPWMRRGEKRWTGVWLGVVTMIPVVMIAASQVLFSPMDPASRPFLLSRAMVAPYSLEMADELRKSLAEHPEDPNLYFALAMAEKRGANFDKAEGYYEKAQTLGANPASVLNNLGVIAFLRGDFDRAMDYLQQSVAQNDQNASAYFNLSQTYAKKLYFEKADQAMLKANSLSFNRIRTALRNSEGEDKRTLIDDPLPTSVFWTAALTEPIQIPRLPGWARAWFAGSVWLLPILVGLSAGFGWFAGRRLYQDLPSKACVNCGRPVCRRCLRRIRHDAYCADCGDVLLRIQSVSYSKLVLDSRIRRKRRLVALVSQAMAWVLPGLHAMRLGHSSLAGLFPVLLAAAALAGMGLLEPVRRLAWTETGPSLWFPELSICLVVMAWLVSGYCVLKLEPVKEPVQEDTETPLTGEFEEGSLDHDPMAA